MDSPCGQFGFSEPGAKGLAPPLADKSGPVQLSFFYDLVREYVALANSEILCFLKTPAETL